jgi:hypothetical protein
MAGGLASTATIFATPVMSIPTTKSGQAWAQFAACCIGLRLTPPTVGTIAANDDAAMIAWLANLRDAQESEMRIAGKQRRRRKGQSKTDVLCR